MTDQLLSLAREVGAMTGMRSDPRFAVARFGGHVIGYANFDADQLTAFAERIRQDERERCAKLCEAERVDAEESDAPEDRAYNWATKHCAAAIRSSGTSGSNSDE